MISASKPEVPPPNEDIRVKLKQLRDGIGYYEAQKSSAARHKNASYIGGINESMDHSSRNNNNSSVLLPELKGSISPEPGGSMHYQSNNSLIGKKSSLERILRGLNDQ